MPLTKLNLNNGININHNMVNLSNKLARMNLTLIKLMKETKDGKIMKNNKKNNFPIKINM